MHEVDCPTFKVPWRCSDMCTWVQDCWFTCEQGENQAHANLVLDMIGHGPKRAVDFFHVQWWAQSTCAGHRLNCSINYYLPTPLLIGGDCNSVASNAIAMANKEVEIAKKEKCGQYIEWGIRVNMGLQQLPDFSQGSLAIKWVRLSLHSMKKDLPAGSDKKASNWRQWKCWFAASPKARKIRPLSA